MNFLTHYLSPFNYSSDVSLVAASTGVVCSLAATGSAACARFFGAGVSPPSLFLLARFVAVFAAPVALARFVVRLLSPPVAGLPAFDVRALPFSAGSRSSLESNTVTWQKWRRSR